MHNASKTIENYKKKTCVSKMFFNIKHDVNYFQSQTLYTYKVRN